jgi:hypothetical protein
MTPKSFLVAVLVLLPAPALAESFDASGVWTFTPEIVPHPVAEDLVALHFSASYDLFEAAGPDFPGADATGRCFGAMVIRAGQASGNGNCHTVDGDGHEIITEWIAEGTDDDGKTTGRWSVIGGNGKYAGAEGGGTWRSGPDATGAYKNEVTGEMTLN